MYIGKHDIRYDNIAYWPNRIKFITLFFITISLLTNSYFFIIKPQIKDLSRAKAQGNQLEKLLITISQQTKELSVLQKKNKFLEMILSPLGRKLYSNKRLPKIIRIITQMLKKADLKLLALHPKKLQTKHFYIVAPLKIKVSGKFKGIVTFMSELIEHKIMFNYKDFNLYKLSDKAKQTSLMFDVNLNIYLKKRINDGK